jgi:hypothetical protein
LRLHQAEAFKAINEGNAIMKKETNYIPFFNLTFRKTIKTRTTLFDVLKTLNEVVEKGEEEFIPQVVLHMTNIGLLKAIR